MPSFTNNSNLPLSMAVWLANDTYAHDSRENHLSATSLLKPIKQLVLAKRVDTDIHVPDILSLVKSRMGTAIHDSIEAAWISDKNKDILRSLGIPKRVAERVVVNPDPDMDLTDLIPVYLELRTEREIDGFIISGQLDFVGEGRLEDFKSTSVYSYINQSNNDKYRAQGSIYRWLNPKIITDDQMAIQFVFTDFSEKQAFIQPNYPPSQTYEMRLNLMSVAETEKFIRNKIAAYKKYLHEKEENIPVCTDEELWRKPTVWKYYKKPDAKRATKVYDNWSDAQTRANMEGGKVTEFPGEIVACRYCEAFPVCKQKDKYIASGELKIKGA